jgi:hypothetical protein
MIPASFVSAACAALGIPPVGSSGRPQSSRTLSHGETDWLIRMGDGVRMGSVWGHPGFRHTNGLIHLKNEAQSTFNLRQM